MSTATATATETRTAYVVTWKAGRDKTLASRRPQIGWAAVESTEEVRAAVITLEPWIVEITDDVEVWEVAAYGRTRYYAHRPGATARNGEVLTYGDLATVTAHPHVAGTTRLASAATIKGALAGARRALAKAAADRAAVAGLARISAARRVGRAYFDKRENPAGLVPSTERGALEVGRVVWVYAAGSLRRGAVESIARTGTVTVAWVAPSNRGTARPDDVRRKKVAPADVYLDA